MRRRDFATAAILAVFIPVVSLGAYLALGAPDYGDQPLAARTGPVDEEELRRLLARAEERLARNPDDARGWVTVAPVYQRLGRFEDAAEAWGRANAILGEDAGRLVAEAENVVMAAGGEITDEARRLFARAAELDPQNVTPAVFLAVAARQRGDYEEATERWRTILSQSEGDEQWLQIAATEFRLMGENAELPGELPLPGAGASGEVSSGGAVPESAAVPPQPSADQMEAAATMDPEARRRMIEGMVEGLARRLEEGGGSAEEWLRLVRSYAVLGEEEEARGTLTRALEALPESEHAVLTRSPEVRQLMDGQ
jgi:cytochrome c-type biogenesis protein CcmH